MASVNIPSNVGQSSMGQQHQQAESGSRITNAQRIQQKKALLRAWPRDRKLEKLASYSSCKVSLINIKLFIFLYIIC